MIRIKIWAYTHLCRFEFIERIRVWFANRRPKNAVEPDIRRALVIQAQLIACMRDTKPIHVSALYPELAEIISTQGYDTIIQSLIDAGLVRVENRHFHYVGR